jgi:hypothetical protein
LEDLDSKAYINSAWETIRENIKTSAKESLAFFIINWTTNGYLRGGSDTTLRQIHILHKITHNAQTKHSNQSYTNNKGHIAHSEYNAKKAKLSL